jgi:hypothetical protein
MIAQKKRDEVRALIRFRDLHDAFPSGEVLPDESPDFRVLADSGVIGVEIRRVFKQPGSEKSAPQIAEAMMRQTIALAKTLADLRGLPNLLVLVDFSRNRRTSDNHVEHLARSLACWVADTLPPEGGKIVADRRHNSAPDPPAGFDKITVSRNKDRSHGAWLNPAAGFALTDAVGLLQDAINQKNAKAIRYADDLDECWLLLVAEGDAPSSMIRPNDASVAHEYESRFNRTFFMNYSGGLLHELSTRAPTD